MSSPAVPQSEFRIVAKHPEVIRFPLMEEPFL